LQGYLGALTIVLLIAIVLTRAALMRRRGTEAMNFGRMDRKDFLIPPFALFYFYLVLANAFGLPSVSRWRFFESSYVSWFGVALCLAGVLLMVLSLISFGRSFRVGIDVEHPDQLVTSGVFAVTRNPIYVAFASVLLGQFLIFSSWILFIYLAAGFWLFHRQVLREETFLRSRYGEEYSDYCRRVRRYL
jgi:protein-S-isoprenylcysteine O-methyltransferase Ste14